MIGRNEVHLNMQTVCQLLQEWVQSELGFTHIKVVDVRFEGATSEEERLIAIIEGEASGFRSMTEYS